MPHERFRGARDLIWRAIRSRADALATSRAAEAAAASVSLEEHRAVVERLEGEIAELRALQARASEGFDSVRTDVRALVERSEWSSRQGGVGVR